MKRNLIALALVLFSGSVLFASAQTSPDRPQPTGSSLIISRYGTLLDVVGADGKSRFGKLEFDGFRVTYKTKGHKAKQVSAVGSTQAKGLLPGEVKSDGRQASVTVMTEDKKLEITSYFTMDEAGRALIIRRKIKNISCEKVWLAPARYFIEPVLFVAPMRELLDRMQLIKENIITWVADICPQGHCDPEPVGGNCGSNVCPTNWQRDEEYPTVVVKGEVLAECPCGPPDKKPANEASTTVKIAIRQNQLR